jgi:hypothetical protein
VHICLGDTKIFVKLLIETHTPRRRQQLAPKDKMENQSNRAHRPAKVKKRHTGGKFPVSQTHATIC